MKKACLILITGIVVLMIVARMPPVRAQPTYYTYTNYAGEYSEETYVAQSTGEQFGILYISIVASPYVNILFLDYTNYENYLTDVSDYPYAGPTVYPLWDSMDQPSATGTLTFNFYGTAGANYYLVFDNTGVFTSYPCDNPSNGGFELYTAVYEPLSGYVYALDNSYYTTIAVPYAAITLSGTVGAGDATCSVTYTTSAASDGSYSLPGDGVPSGSYTATLSSTTTPPPDYTTSTTPSFTVSGQAEDLYIPLTLYTVSGQVSSTITSTVISGATVTFTGDPYQGPVSTVTTSGGYYSVSLPDSFYWPGGTYTVTATVAGTVYSVSPSCTVSGSDMTYNIGIPAVPEFPSVAFLPLLMILTLFAAVLAKKRSSKKP